MLLRQTRISRVVFLSVLVASSGVGWWVFSRGQLTFADLEVLLRLYPSIAPLAFVFAHILAAVLFLPCSPFTFIAGLLWPLEEALPLSITAALVATAITFLIGRFFRPANLLSEIEHSPVRRLLAFTSRHDWKIVALTFLNPAMPSATLGYVFGMSKISLSRFLVSALIAMLPLQLALVTLGGAARSALLIKVWMASGVLLLVAGLAVGVWLLVKRKAGENMEEVYGENRE